MSPISSILDNVLIKSIENRKQHLYKKKIPTRLIFKEIIF